MADGESLVFRRPRRSTAGNRMELALAELALEETREPEEDVDFVVDKEEEDVFESDFASTDEEATQGGVEEGDSAVREEERRQRKTARARVEKATAIAHARHRVTFNPGATSLQPKSHPSQKTKRRVSLGVVVNAETGEVIEGNSGTAGATRQSQRRHTVMNTSATVNRMKDAEEKRAAIPKKTKTITRLPTQDELVARALDTEEGNTMEHRNYLHLEEEKRAKARVVKKSIDGPVLRWISKKETIQVETHLPAPPLPTGPATGANLYAGRYSFVYTSGTGAGTVGMPLLPSASSWQQQQPQQSQTPFQPPQPPPPAQTHAQASSQSQTLSPFLFSYAPIPAAPLIAYRSENVCKNYVIHELAQSVPSKPAWKDTMSAMFGDHVQWDEVKVFTGKGRPMSRPIRTCPITGQSAKYRDPRTNVPFADVDAYAMLTRVLGRGFVWSSSLECYVGVDDTTARRDAAGTGGHAEGSGDADAVSKTGEGSGGVMAGDREVEAPEERSTKRRRVGIADG